MPIISLEGHFAITVSLSMHDIKFKKYWEDGRIHTKILNSRE
jgi:hypothetical protein